MTAFDYTRAKNTATRLITYFGQSGIIRRFTVSSGNRFTPGAATPSHTDYTCTLAVTEYSYREIDGTLIKATDKRIYVSTNGLAISPAVKDQVVIGGEVMEIMRVTPISPAGTVVVWELQARNG